MGNAQSNQLQNYPNVREYQRKSREGSLSNGSNRVRNSIHGGTAGLVTTKSNIATTETTKAIATATTSGSTSEEPKSQPIISNNNKKLSMYGSSPFVGSPLYFNDHYGKRINRSNSTSRDDLSSPRSLNSSHMLKESYDPNFSSPHSSTKDENTVALPHSNKKSKKTVPTIITWNKGGQNVYLTGTFNNWSAKIPLNKSTNDFSTVINLPVGTHRFKFIVDDVWKCSDELPTASDIDGNLINYIEVTDDSKKDDLFIDNIDSINGYSESPPEEYTDVIPSYLTSTVPNYYSDNINVDYNEDEQPPLLPPHLEKVLLNTHHKNEDPSKEDPMVLPIPNHVVLNHLYTLSIRDGVMALGTTSRYRKKYVTTLYYKPIEFPWIFKANKKKKKKKKTKKKG